MRHLAVVATLACAVAAAPPAFAKPTAVSTGGTGNFNYDSSALTLTATAFPASATLISYAGNGQTDYDSVGALATLRLDFAAPLVRDTSFFEREFTGTGYRYIRSNIVGTVTGFHLSVDALDGTNLLTLDSLPGFSGAFEHFTSLDYYYYPDGTVREGTIHLLDYYSHFLSTKVLLLNPPCNCSDSTIFRPPTTLYSLTSDVPDYVPNIYPPSNYFDTFVLGATADLDLYAVTGASRVVLGDFSGQISYGLAQAVPEPASWALLIAGFGLTGAALRRRHVVSARRT